MKYKNISSTLGWAEEPQTEEGLFLQPEEAAKIESTLEAAAANLVELSLKSETITELQTSIDSKEEQIKLKDAKIAKLEGEVSKLSGESSGKGSNLNIDEDEANSAKGASSLPRFDSPDHPANKAAARVLRK
jgi:uncharacterized protein YccT (UPF0319 family)